MVRSDYDDKWFVVYYQSGSILPNGSIELDTCCGDNENQLSINLAEFTDVNALRFHRYPIAPGHLIDHDMLHILNALFPEIKPGFELSHYQPIIDKTLSNSLKKKFTDEASINGSGAYR